MISRVSIIVVAMIVVASTLAGTAYMHNGKSIQTPKTYAINFKTHIVNTTFPVPAGTIFKFSESYWSVPVFNVDSYENVTVSWTSTQNVTPVIYEVNTTWNNLSFALILVPGAHNGFYLPPSLGKLPVPSTSGSYISSFVPGRFIIILLVPNPISKNGFTITLPDGIGQ